MKKGTQSSHHATRIFIVDIAPVAYGATVPVAVPITVSQAATTLLSMAAPTAMPTPNATKVVVTTAAVLYPGVRTGAP
jgi:hypothetical protein